VLAVDAKVKNTFHSVVRASGVQPRRALEVGGVMGEKSLLLCPELDGAERHCLNLVELASADGVNTVVGNANDMAMFEDESFDLVMSNATLEHDKYFWRSLAEMHRVLAPGGMLMIGVPGYVENPQRDHGKATHTYRVHYRFDYYRFSEQVVREVFFEGMEDVAAQAIMNPPRIIGVGFRPGGSPAAVDRQAAARALAAGPVTVTGEPVARKRRGRRRGILGRT
jgi:SAM-dependent methyltransferase